MDCTQSCKLGRHYQFVAQKSVLKRAISNEIMTKRGLVIICDYYQKVHIFNFELNRHVPNGMHGGVRGWIYFTLLDCILGRKNFLLPF